MYGDDKPRLVDYHAIDTNTFSDKQLEQMLRLTRFDGPVWAWGQQEDRASLLDLVEKLLRRAQAAEGVKQEYQDLVTATEKPAPVALTMPGSFEEFAITVLLMELRESPLMRFEQYNRLVDFVEQLHESYLTKEAELSEMTKQFQDSQDEVATLRTRNNDQEDI